jgi:hypothetical protein
MDTRQIIDYAEDGNAVEFRNALYASIHDKVTAHVNAAKQAVAQNMFASEEETEEQPEVEQPQDNDVENS